MAKEIATSDSTIGNAVAFFSPVSKAMSVEVGKAVLASLQVAETNAETAANALAEVNRSKHAVTTAIINATLKAAKNDPRIKLEASFGDNRKEQTALNAAILVAIGLKEIRTINPDTGVKEAVWTTDAKKFFEFNGDDKTEAGKLQKTKMSERNKNFSQILKRAEQTAQGMIDIGANVTLPRGSDVLMIEGPEVAKLFNGETKVLLNETAIDGAKLNTSYKAIRDHAEESRKAKATGQGHDGKTKAPSTEKGPSAAGSLEAFGELTNRMITSINSLEEPTSEHVKYLMSLKTAVEASLAKAHPVTKKVEKAA